MSRLIEGQDSSASVRRVARNAVVRSLAEIVGKFATFAMFVLIARKLGPTGFGDITFAIALTGNLLVISGVGMDIVVSRETIRNPSLLGTLMATSLVIKLATSVPALLITAAVLEFGNYSTDTRIATYLIFVSMLLDTLENTWNAALQAYERLELVSAVIVFQRLVNGALVVAVVAAGKGVVAVAGTFVVVSVAAILLAMWLLRLVVSPKWSVQRSRFVPILRAAIPVGLSGLLLIVLLRVDTVLLSLIAGNHAVGIYGAAFRIFESTMFLTLSFASATFPWFSRRYFETNTQSTRGYEMSIVVILSLLTPIGLSCILLAGPIIHVLYGSSYDAAVLPLRLLGTVVVTFGINYLTTSTLAAHDRPRLMHRILLVTVIQNIAMNLILIPPYGATGAALSAAVSGLLLAALSIRQVMTAFGGVRLRRILLGPTVGAVAMTLAILPVRNSLVGGLLLGGASYFGGLLLTERLFFPDDFARLLSAARLRAKGA